MGQAVVDLPDPLENGNVTSAASADDLLAQLASDEIDRLLAEADADTAPLPPAEPASPPAGTAAARDVSAAEAPLPPLSTPPTLELPAWLTAELPPASASRPGASAGRSAAPPAASAPAPVAPAARARASSEIAPPLSSAAAALGEELDQDAAMGTQLSSLAPTPIEAPAPIAHALHSKASPPIGHAGTAETAPPKKPVPPRFAEPDESVADEAEAEIPLEWQPGELPLILKPLEWINAPLNLCPDNVRELVGKIAILTLVNAAAVLAYVWIFRRHH
jgi:hypothetical protein